MSTEIEKLNIQVAELKNSLAQAKQHKTLRDEFAMAAMSALGKESSSEFAYAIADGMMKERTR